MRIAALIVALLGAGWVSTARADKPPPLKLRPLIVKDPAVNNAEAFRMLVPSDWKVQGGVVWDHSRSNLATSPMMIWNPNGSEGLQLYPIVPYTWTQQGIQGFGPGSNYLGNIVAAPMDPASYVGNVLMPNFRPAVQSAQLIGRTPLPDVAKLTMKQVAEPTMRKTVNAERIRVGYTYEGKAYHEDFYVVIVYASGDQLPGTTWWHCERLYSFRAAAGELDDHADLLQAMVSSVRINPKWLTVYLQVQQMWIKNRLQAIRDAGRLGRMISQTYDEIREINRAAYENHQRSQDEMNRKFTNVIRGVEEYVNPHTNQRVALPHEYQYTWVSEAGEYTLSHDPNYDPNHRGTGTWQRMKVYKPAE